MTSWDRVEAAFGSGSRPLKPAEDLSLAEVLLANRLPPSLFQAYAVSPDGSRTAIPVTTVPAALPADALLDACYPEYSERNYSERDDLTTTQRSSVYFLAHCVDALAPQLSISLMTGVKRLMDDIDGWQQLFPVVGTPLMTTGQADRQVQDDVLGLLHRYFPSWSPTTGELDTDRGTASR